MYVFEQKVYHIRYDVNKVEQFKSMYLFFNDFYIITMFSILFICISDLCFEYSGIAQPPRNLVRNESSRSSTDFPSISVVSRINIGTCCLTTFLGSDRNRI